VKKTLKIFFIHLGVCIGLFILGFVSYMLEIHGGLSDHIASGLPFILPVIYLLAITLISYIKNFIKFVSIGEVPNYKGLYYFYLFFFFLVGRKNMNSKSSFDNFVAKANLTVQMIIGLPVVNRHYKIKKEDVFHFVVYTLFTLPHFLLLLFLVTFVNSSDPSNSLELFRLICVFGAVISAGAGMLMVVFRLLFDHLKERKEQNRLLQALKDKTEK